MTLECLVLSSFPSLFFGGGVLVVMVSSLPPSLGIFCFLIFGGFNVYVYNICLCVKNKQTFFILSEQPVGLWIVNDSGSLIVTTVKTPCFYCHRRRLHPRTTKGYHNRILLLLCSG